MPPLLDFVGSREAGTQSLTSDKSTEKSVRMQAILQNLASTNGVKPTNPGDNSQDGLRSRRREIGIQQRVVLPPAQTHHRSPRPLDINIRWQDHRTQSFPKETTNSLNENQPKSEPGFENHQDTFGTDIENFDDTVASSDTSNTRPRIDDSTSERNNTRLNSENSHDEQQYDDMNLGNTNEQLLNEFAIRLEGGEYQSEDEQTQSENPLVEGLVSQICPNELNDFQDDQDISQGFAANIVEKSPSRVTAQFHENLTLRGSGSISKHTSYQPYVISRSETHCAIEPLARTIGLEQVPTDRKMREVLYSRKEVEYPKADEFPTAAWTHKNAHKKIEVPQPSQDPHNQSHGSALSTSQLPMSRNRQDGQAIGASIMLQHQQRSPAISPAPTISGLADAESVNKDMRDTHDRNETSTDTPKHPIDLDYNYAQLNQMAYQDLSHEDFDFDPHAVTTSPVRSLTISELSNKLQNIFDMRGGLNLPSQRENAFSSLSIEQYEQCGDLMMERFNKVIAGYSAARLRKRKVARAMEDEIASRENIVQAKKKAIDDDLNRLRNAGKDVIRGKRSC